MTFDYFGTFLLLCILFSTPANITNTERNDFVNDLTTRETIEKVIREKAEAPETTAAEIEQLARAYSELSKNDHMREMYDTLSKMSAFNGHANTPAQLHGTGTGDCPRDPL